MMVKTKLTALSLPFLTFTLLAIGASGCATGQSARNNASQDTSASGPSVVYARSEPSTVELNRDFQPTQPAEVLADVKDAESKVSDVKLQFTSIPLEIPMENIGGTTWRAQLTPRQLEMLAVSGRTTRYEANVIARNQDGKTSMTTKPVDVAVKAPDLTGAGTGSG
jgi:hypothetical protein